MSEDLRCDDVREVAPDLALGLLTGEERADALAHLERCEACRAEVASLSGAVDEVLLAAPEVAPPPGFAARVLARVAAERAAGDGLPAVSGRPAAAAGPPLERSRPRPRPRPRSVARAGLAVAAAVLLVAGLVAVVRGVGGGGSSGAEVAVAEMRTGTGEVVGAATAEGDATSVVTLDVPGWDSMVEQWGDAPDGSSWIVVEQQDGTRTMRALDDDGDGPVHIDAPVDDLATVSMLDDQGRVWCTGRFAPA